MGPRDPGHDGDELRYPKVADPRVICCPAGRDWPWLRQVVVDVISSCDAIGEALGANGSEAFSENPLSRPHFASRERPVLLIFDGLDELA